MPGIKSTSRGASGKALKGGLAGAAALASGSQAYAAIIVVPPPANLPNVAAPGTAGPLNWDVNSDTVVDFQFSFRFPNSATQVHWQANVFNPIGSTNAVIGYNGPFIRYATRLAAGANIGAAGPWFGQTAGQEQVVLGSRYGAGAGLLYGGFGTPTPGRGFLGLRFKVGGQDRFGWLDLEVREPSSPTATNGGIYFFGAAWENTGQPIQAGQIPEPGTLAALALGALGVLSRRNR